MWDRGLALVAGNSVGAVISAADRNLFYGWFAYCAHERSRMVALLWLSIKGAGDC